MTNVVAIRRGKYLRRLNVCQHSCGVRDNKRFVKFALSLFQHMQRTNIDRENNTRNKTIKAITIIRRVDLSDRKKKTKCK